MKVAAYADVGGLGTKQGPQVAVVWTVPSLLPLVLPWLVLLTLLALPSNRDARAWWIWAPLICVTLLGAGLGQALGVADEDGLGFSLQAAVAAAFGLAAVWLLGAALARRCRAVSIGLMALAFAAISLLTLAVSPVSEQVWDLARWASEALWYLLLFAIVTGLVFAGALNLTGRTCRQQFSRLRLALLFLLWLWVMWIAAAATLACVVRLASGDSQEWYELAKATVVFSLVSFAVLLPFLILSFSSSFYRERLKVLLRLPAPAAAPAAAAPVSIQATQP